MNVKQAIYMLMKNRYKRKLLFQNNNIDYSVREFTIPNANEYQRFEVTFQNNDGRRYVEIFEPNQTQLVSKTNVGGGTTAYEKMALAYLNTSTNKLTLSSVGQHWTASNGTGGVQEGNFITVLKVVGILGGGITLAISTLSALVERWWKHDYQTNAICDFAEGETNRNGLFQRRNSNSIKHSARVSKHNSSERHIHNIGDNSTAINNKRKACAEQTTLVGRRIFDARLGRNNKRNINTIHIPCKRIAKPITDFFSVCRAKCINEVLSQSYTHCLTVRGCVA